MGLFPNQNYEYATIAHLGLPRGPKSHLYFVDPLNGSASNTGTSFASPLLTVKEALAKCVTNNNDAVVMIGGPTRDTVATTALTWNLDYTHLVGLSAPLPGVGQRCRIGGAATNDVTEVANISGKGCIFKNIQFQNESDASAAARAATISGSRCYFENVFFAGMLNTTSASVVGGCSVALSGDENTFRSCTIGAATQERLAATYELILSGECNRNKFIDCEFVSWSNQATSAMVDIAAGAVPYTTQFKNCAFLNLKSNNGATGTAMGHAIIDGCTTHHVVTLEGACPLFGISAYADPVTYVFQAQAQPHANGGIVIVGA